MTRCDMSGPSNRSSLVFFLTCAALAAIVLGVGANAAYAVGLKYVDGLPGSTFGETPNLFRSNGTSLGTPGATDVFTSETNVDTDNAWGWRNFGATNSIYGPFVYSSVYESGDEDAPEFQARLTGADGIAASTAYDVYVAYWADMTGNWAVRAGLQPGTMEAPLQVFANFDTTVAGETPGTFASSGAWDMPPLDNPTDPNPGATDNNVNPFLDVTPGAPANSARNMLLGLVGTITSGSQSGAAANEIRVWIDDLPPSGNGGVQRRGWFDGLAFVPAGTQVFMTAEVDRDTGNLLVHNTTDAPFTVVSYSIVSAAGALDGSGAGNAPWNNLTAGTIPNYTDTDDDWAVVAPPEFATELREDDGGVLANTGAQDGIVLPANDAIPLNLGDVWRFYPFEDVQVQLRLADGTPETFDDNPSVVIIPTFSGDVAVRGDFTGDGMIDVLDYISLMQNLHKPQGDLTRAEYYSHGDYNDDDVVDRGDFFFFRTAYFQANPGAGAAGFAALAAEAAAILGRGAIPEPSTLWLAMLGVGFFCARSHRRARNQVRQLNKENASMNCCTVSSRRLGAAVLALVAGAIVASDAQAVPVVGWQRDPLIGNDAPIANTDTNSPTIGDGTTNSADDVTIWGATPSAIHLDDTFEAILSGRVRFFPGPDGGGASGRDFRWGMWKRVDNGAPDPTGAWLGYLAAGGSGATSGRLYARNPDDGGFSTASFISTFGDISVAQTAGPAPAAGPGSQFTDFNNVGTGTGRYFLLAEPPVNNNAPFFLGDPGEEIWFSFEIRVGRYGNEVDVSGSLVADPAPADGDYNNNNIVDAADFTVWRDNLGKTLTPEQFPNRAAENTGPISQADYDTWKANFGATGGTPYELRLGGGLDFDGRPPAALDAMGNPVPFTSHLTFDFDRVGFLFGNAMNLNQAQLQDVDISTAQIETLDLLVDTTTGAVQIRNNLATPFEIDYYEITSTLGVLESDNWTSLDAADGGLPVTNDYLTGWDVAEGSLGPNGDFVLSEGNFVGSSTVEMGSPINLGDVFKTGTPVEDRDIRFFAGIAGGGVIRGTVTYSSAGLGSLAGVPEPATAWLLWSAVAFWAVAGWRGRPA